MVLQNLSDAAALEAGLPADDGVVVVDSVWSRAWLPIAKWIRYFAITASGIGVVGLFGVVLYGIIERELLHRGATWTSEVSGFILIFVAFVGVITSMVDHTQPRIAILVQLLPRRTQTIVEAAVSTITIGLYLYVVMAGFSSDSIMASTRAVSLPISLADIAIIIPITAIVMLVVGCGNALVRFGWSGFGPIVIGLVVAVVVYERIFYVDQSYFAEVLLVGFVVILLAGCPVGESLLISGALAYSVAEPFGTNAAFAGHMFNAFNDNFNMVAVPLLLLVGTFVAGTSCARRIIDFFKSFVGWLPGGLAVTDVGASAIFADMSGSATADTVAIGAAMLPELERDGYPPEVAAGLQAAAGTLGLMFPPSISMLLYASVANVSVAKMFAAIIVPGIMVAFSFCVVAVFISRKNSYGTVSKPSLHGAVHGAIGAVPSLGLPAVILIGLFGGVFSATESGAIGVTYIVVVTALLYRELRPGLIARIVGEAATTASRVLYIIMAALTFGWLLVESEVPQKVAKWLGDATTNATLTLVLVMLMLVVVHTVLESSTTILVVVPLLLPVLQAHHIDLIQFGVLVAINSAIGLVLPPIGLCMYLVSSISSARVEQVAKSVLPYVAALVVDLVIVLFFPQILHWSVSVLS